MGPAGVERIADGPELFPNQREARTECGVVCVDCRDRRNYESRCLSCKM